MTPAVRELRIVYSAPVQAGPPSQVGRPADAVALLRDRLEVEPVEVCLVLLVSTRHHVIGVHELSRGTLDTTLVHPREVFKSAILGNAAGVIVAHYVARNIMRLMCPESLCAGVNATTPTSAVRRSKEDT